MITLTKETAYYLNKLVQEYKQNPQKFGTGTISPNNSGFEVHYVLVEEQEDSLPSYKGKISLKWASERFWQELPLEVHIVAANNESLSVGSRYIAVRYGDYNNRPLFVASAASGTTDTSSDGTSSEGPDESSSSSGPANCVLVATDLNCTTNGLALTRKYLRVNPDFTITLSEDPCDDSSSSASPTISYYEIVQVDGSDQTQRGKLNLVAGTNITLTPVDDSGNDRTTITIDAADPNYQTVQRNTVSQTQRGKLNLIEGTNVTLSAADNAGNDSTDITINATGGTSYYQTVQDGGSDQTQRSKLNFVDGGNITVVCSDDAGGNRTNVTITATADTHNLLSATHTDTNSVAASRGDLIVRNNSSLWTRLAIGTANYVLTSNGTDPSWALNPYNTVQDNGTNRTQRSKLNVASGTNTTLSATDDAGNDRTTLTVNVPNADDSTRGAIEIAIQSELEAASSTSLAVPPGRMIYHPGVCKAFVRFDGTAGSLSADHSYNLSSLSDLGTGYYRATWSVSCSAGTKNVPVVCCGGSGGRVKADLVSRVQVGTNAVEAACSDGTDTLVDSDIVSILTFGDL